MAQDCAAATALDRQIDIVFDHMVLQPYRMLAAMPDAEDLITGINPASRDEIARMEERNRAFLEELLIPYAGALSAFGLDPVRLSDFVRNAATGFKHNADSEDHLNALLGALKTVTLAVCGQASAAQSAAEKSHA